MDKIEEAIQVYTNRQKSFAVVILTVKFTFNATSQYDIDISSFVRIDCSGYGAFFV